ncbi:MAG: glycosyl hydrolase [Candidatus Margulisiibacteriota bacterium]
MTTTTTTTIPASTCAVGAFVNGMDNITSFQTTIGKKLAVVLWYVHWQSEFPSSEADTVAANGSVPLITWEPRITHSLGTLEAIASGSYESYVRGFIQAAKNWGKPILLRFGHEMNGNWYPWDGFNNGAASGPEKYKRAWIYIYNVREELKADNISLVWCVNNTNLPVTSWNTIEAYYPGDQYVDWVGMDGYNWGDSRWQSFDAVFAEVYAKLTALTSKPLLIGEFASSDQGGNKVGWITDAFAKIESDYPKVKLFCWFNINKERDWRVESSSSAEAAVKNALQDGYFSSKM